MAILGLHHVAFSTPDLDRLVAFYRDVVGFPLVFETQWPAGQAMIDAIMETDGTAARAAILSTGNGFLEIIEFATPAPKLRTHERRAIDHGIGHICLAVDDAAAEYTRLQGAGVRFHCPPIETGLPVTGTYGRDPDGNIIELLEVRDPTSPIHFDGRSAR